MKYPDTCFQVHQVQENIRQWGRRREGRILESVLYAEMYALHVDPQINLTLGLFQKPTNLTANSYSVNWSEGVYWLYLSVHLL